MTNPAYLGIKEYNPKQKIALKKLNNNDKVYYHHYGGARSGKTALDTRYFILRALKYPGTRQLFCRASKASCIVSIWMMTLLPMLESDFKGSYTEDQTKRIINFVNGSSIWAGGFDNIQHTDEMLAKEWAGILVEEATELKYNDFQKLITRLNWNPKESHIPLKMILECNPVKLSHWLHQYFFDFIDYETKERLAKSEISEIEKEHFSPEDNKKNLNKRYLEKLRNLKGRARKRFYDGIYSDDTEGLIYEFNRAENCTDEPIEYDPDVESWRAWDFGIHPSDNAILWIQVLKVPESKMFPEGIRINVIHEYINNEKDYKHYANYVKDQKYKNNDFSDAGDPAGHSRNESLKSWISRLAEESIYIQTPKGAPSIDDFISNANHYMPYIRVNESQCPRFVETCENWTRTKDREGRAIEGSKPEHNVFSHPGTAYYYWIMVRFPYKKGEVYLP